MNLTDYDYIPLIIKSKQLTNGSKLIVIYLLLMRVPMPLLAITAALGKSVPNGKRAILLQLNTTIDLELVTKKFNRSGNLDKASTYELNLESLRHLR
jgi:hypothetical protein